MPSMPMPRAVGFARAGSITRFSGLSCHVLAGGEAPSRAEVNDPPACSQFQGLGQLGAVAGNGDLASGLRQIGDHWREDAVAGCDHYEPESGGDVIVP